MEDTIAEKLLTIAENEQNVFNAGYEKGLASGGVTINNQDKTVTENGVYQADEGYTGLGTVTVEVASTGGGDIDAILDGSISVLTSEAQSIASHKFYQSKAIMEVNLPNATKIGVYAFQECTNLRTVNIPLVNTICASAFYQCSNLATLSADEVEFIDSNAFRFCDKLEFVSFKEIYSVGIGAFAYCRALKKADLYEINDIQSSGFGDCGALTSVVIRRTNRICELKNESAFANTGIANGIGYIYVPKDLVESYKSATNWSNFATQFRALEDYTVDGTITGELDESKI